VNMREKDVKDDKDCKDVNIPLSFASLPSFTSFFF